ncbi:hypothetical protein [Halorubrum ezzemoulense]|uniref:hypothetical protein n=1 Tax=Halorubrum ezzemoulense TaxID=337243 RepID=UPI0011818D94|nr:hypothetical protein [Halorubrum ezzemoulense]
MEIKLIFTFFKPVFGSTIGVETAELQSELEEKGELMLAVSEFDEPLEMHLHDSEIEDGVIKIQLTDGVLTFDVDEVVAVWHHTHSLADFGLED